MAKIVRPIQLNKRHYPCTEEMFHSTVDFPDMSFAQIHLLTRILVCNWKSRQYHT